MESSAVRAELRTWLAAELPAGWLDAIDTGDLDTVARLRSELDYADWCRRLGRSGYATPTWPAEYGAGRSMSARDARVVHDELTRTRVPRPFNVLGIGLAGPTILEWGTEEQKHRLLLPIATNEEIWCQMFSEPGSGSDLAGLATRAVRDGDEWVLNGQKVWTTLAHVAKWAMVVTRTDPDVPKHRGLSYFLMDMHAPGVEVRPLVQMTGDAEFNEVFMADVRVPDSMRLGPEGRGWDVALTTLMNERVALSGAGSIGGDAVGGSSVDRLIARHAPVSDLITRQRLAQAHIDSRVIKLTNARAAATRRAGRAGPEGSITKLMQAEFNQRLQKLAVDLEGLGGIAWEGPGLHVVDNELGTFRPTDRGDAAGIVRGFLRAQANSIEGGTSNVMRNILGERVLGLPKEPDPFKGRAWKDVPHS